MPRKNKRGSKRIKKKTFVPDDPELAKAPKSFIFCREGVGGLVSALASDLRQAFLPFTAMHLKVRKKNTVKDLIGAAKPLGVTHFQVLTCSDTGTFIRMARVPVGPTIQFQIKSFETSSDVRKSQRRPFMDTNAGMVPAIPVLNNFNNSEKPHVKMAQTLLTNLYPELRVDKVKIGECKRVMLFNLDKETELIDVRQYGVVGHRQTANKAVKRLEKNRLPKRMNKMSDISELLLKGDAYYSDSDGEAEEMVLPQKFRKLEANSKSLIKLVEIGPRMTLSINKIVAGFLDGEVLYHSTIKRTPEEIEDLKRIRKKKEAERKARRAAQEEKVAEKKAVKEEKKKRREKRLAEGKGSGSDEGESDLEDPKPSAYDEEDFKEVGVRDDVEESDDEDLGEDEGSPDEASDDDDSPMEEEPAPAKVRAAERAKSSKAAPAADKKRKGADPGGSLFKRQKTSGIEPGFQGGDGATMLPRGPEKEKRERSSRGGKGRNTSWIDRKREREKKKKSQ